MFKETAYHSCNPLSVGEGAKILEEIQETLKSSLLERWTLMDLNQLLHFWLVCGQKWP